MLLNSEGHKANGNKRVQPLLKHWFLRTDLLTANIEPNLTCRIVALSFRLPCSLVWMCVRAISLELGLVLPPDRCRNGAVSTCPWSKLRAVEIKAQREPRGVKFSSDFKILQLKSSIIWLLVLQSPVADQENFTRGKWPGGNDENPASKPETERKSLCTTYLSPGAVVCLHVSRTKRCYSGCCRPVLVLWSSLYSWVIFGLFLYWGVWQ